MFLPTETFFDDESWWSGQFMYNVVASYFFPQQWLQMNALYCENFEHRGLKQGLSSSSQENLQAGHSDAAAHTVKTYRRIVSFQRPLIWLVSSFKLSDKCTPLPLPPYASPS
jgi:hypothetical protein